MNKYIAIALILLAVPVMAQESVRVAEQGFEDTSWQTEFTGNDWLGKLLRVSNTSFEGSYSLRWNQYTGRSDPITGATGIGNPLFDWRGSGHNFYASTPNGAYFSLAYRHDDYRNDATADSSRRKLFYIVDQVMGVGGMYIKFQGGTRTLQISCCNGYLLASQIQWYHDNWGYAALALLDGSSPALDGVWHTFAVYFNYVEGYMQFWQDGNLLRPWDSGNDSHSFQNVHPQMYAERKVPWHPDFDYHAKGFQIMYYAPSVDSVNEADETGYYAGVQIDKLEFWDGIPDSTFVGDTTPPDPPAGFSGSVAPYTTYMSWTPNTESDLAGYLVYSSASSGAPYDLLTSQIISATSYSESGLTEDIPVYYVTKAVDTSGNQSDYSSEITLTPIAAPASPDTITRPDELEVVE